ncbi:hypothetical protein EDEG_01507 [Edhazardia aedis USNM 41457]|uniref:Uncharacterized protein n=1 Tax=Edhazardia aedis (strain USNM 41457) TaxID=1003232 RepID=J9D9M8_EDHAE|nr:hypothetical protein EDEG_01507 [Edhazardia aedis USNM 41457]|eukprot:EJW04209.1 hypothetical protein EDEG_01507 [Edhazardia aedis USNM 41457]
MLFLENITVLVCVHSKILEYCKNDYCASIRRMWSSYKYTEEDNQTIHNDNDKCVLPKPLFAFMIKIRNWIFFVEIVHMNDRYKFKYGIHTDSRNFKNFNEITDSNYTSSNISESTSFDESEKIYEDTGESYEEARVSVDYIVKPSISIEELKSLIKEYETLYKIDKGNLLLAMKKMNYRSEFDPKIPERYSTVIYVRGAWIANFLYIEEPPFFLDTKIYRDGEWLFDELLNLIKSQNPKNLDQNLLLMVEKQVDGNNIILLGVDIDQIIKILDQYHKKQNPDLFVRKKLIAK